MVRWRRRLAWWARQKRVGLWAVILLVLGTLAFGVVWFTDAASLWQPRYYEPKDIEREPAHEGLRRLWEQRRRILDRLKR